MRESACQIDEFALSINVKNIFNSHPEFLLRDVNSGLDGKNHSRSNSSLVIAVVMHTQSYKMAESVNEILAERLPMQVFTMGINVIEGNVVERVGRFAAKVRLARLECVDGRLLCSQNSVIDFPLARRELPGYR